jgi:PAS domain S-box-containing protein
MSYPSLELIWGIIAIFTVLLILAISVTASIVVHSRKIRESEHKFRLLFNRVFDTLLLMDESGRIVDANESACMALGYSRDELLELNLRELIPEENYLEFQADLEKSMEEGLNYFGEASLIGKRKGVIHVEVGGTSLKIGGSTYVLGSFRDVTARREAQEALRKKNITLKEVLAHLEEEKLKIKKQVASTVDQELLPALNRLRAHDGTLNTTFYDLLKNNLQELGESSGAILHAYSKLSPREVEICNLTKNGSTSKETARTLNISLATVNKHRERIRKKLVISNKNINLASFLKEL